MTWDPYEEDAPSPTPGCYCLLYPVAFVCAYAPLRWDGWKLRRRLSLQGRHAALHDVIDGIVSARAHLIVEFDPGWDVDRLWTSTLAARQITDPGKILDPHPPHLRRLFWPHLSEADGDASIFCSYLRRGQLKRYLETSFPTPPPASVIHGASMGQRGMAVRSSGERVDRETRMPDLCPFCAEPTVVRDCAGVSDRGICHVRMQREECDRCRRILGCYSTTGGITSLVSNELQALPESDAKHRLAAALLPTPVPLGDEMWRVFDLGPPSEILYSTTVGMGYTVRLQPTSAEAVLEFGSGGLALLAEYLRDPHQFPVRFTRPTTRKGT